MQGEWIAWEWSGSVQPGASVVAVVDAGWWRGALGQLLAVQAQDVDPMCTSPLCQHTRH